MKHGTARLETLLRHTDPVVATILDRALSEREITAEEGRLLYDASGPDLHLIGLVADELRRRRVGDTVTYVVNRNINFTNVCVKQCGFCAFSRDFREEEGYMLPVSEIVRRAKEARRLGATEVCIQAGLIPDMRPGTYEDICSAIKREVPGIHIHGFSPEEVLYGASRSQVSVREYLGRLKDAGVDTLPGTSAEILDQRIRDLISPGRISVKDWMDVIKTAHRMGIRTTATMMYGHVETARDRVGHMALLREIQQETKGFTEFVPLNFIFDEAPMYRLGMHNGIKKGADAREVLLTHAISRIMLDGFINNIQVSWVKEGPAISQLLLAWGVNDFGGTLINESISTSAGSAHGQLLRPKQIRALIRDAGRTPAERNTRYDLLNVLEREPPDGTLDTVNPGIFGSYFSLVGDDGFRYKNPRSA